MSDLSYIASFLQARDGFTILCHVSPDGDTLGSALALYAALQRMDKRAQVVCQDAVPAVYRFLPGADALRFPEQAERLPNVICVDCAAKDRLGSALKLLEAAEHSINIDHHLTNDAYADDNCIMDTAATGEIIFDLLEMLNMIDAAAATCLYTALMTDTGNFSYANTTPETLHKAAELLEDGADNAYINTCVYRMVPLRKTRLLALALEKLELYCDGKLGVIRISQQDMKKVGASSEDMEGIIDHVRDIDTVELAVVVRESSQPGTGKISMRSKNNADVSTIAVRMGGGGHMRAAGYTDHGSFEQICERAIEMSRALLENEQDDK